MTHQRLKTAFDRKPTLISLSALGATGFLFDLRNNNPRRDTKDLREPKYSGWRWPLSALSSKEMWLRSVPAPRGKAFLAYPLLARNSKSTLPHAFTEGFST